MSRPRPHSEVSIVGIGRTDYTLHSGRTTLAMAAEAGHAALSDAGLGGTDVDGVVTYGINDTALAVSVARAVGTQELSWAVDLYGGGNAVITALSLAANAIRGGQCRTALLYRSLNGRSGQRLGEASSAIGAVVPDAEFDMPQGYALPPQFAAMWARRHQHVHHSTCEDLGHIAITQRRHASMNPHAIAREPLTMEGYLAGRWINEPLRVYDCAFEVDGAVALVLTATERARDLRAAPVHVLAAAESHSQGGSWDQWSDLTSMFSARIARRLLSQTDVALGDIDVACIYDCFTYTVMAVMEDFGFFDKGEAGEFFSSGRATYGGDVVVNPHGGLLSEGYIHGLNSHFEAVTQLRGDADGRQVPNARIALATGGSGPFGGAVLYAADA
jgi:acetyl-CoA acetyltransferase